MNLETLAQILADADKYERVLERKIASQRAYRARKREAKAAAERGKAPTESSAPADEAYGWSLATEGVGT